MRQPSAERAVGQGSWQPPGHVAAVFGFGGAVTTEKDGRPASRRLRVAISRWPKRWASLWMACLWAASRVRKKRPQPTTVTRTAPSLLRTTSITVGASSHSLVV